MKKPSTLLLVSLLLVGAAFSFPYHALAVTTLLQESAPATNFGHSGDIPGTYTGLADGVLRTIVFPSSIRYGGTPSDLLTITLAIGGSNTDCTAFATYGSLGVTSATSTATLNFESFSGTGCNISTTTTTYGFDVTNTVPPDEGFNAGGRWVFTAYDAPPTAIGDGDLTSHVISVVEPIQFATTTSPVTIGFDYILDGIDPITGYSIVLTKDTTGETQTIYGSLSSTATGTPLREERTVTLSTSGTWSVRIDLNNWTPTTGQSDLRFVNRSAWSSFAIDFQDNLTTTIVLPGVGASMSYASTSCNVNFLGSFSLSDCMGYLFLPDNTAFNSYQSVKNTIESKFPFSYVSSIAQTWKSLTASTTANSPTLSLNYHDAGLGSTTAMGNILPNVTALSASTVQSYFPSGTFDLLKGLASIALILGLFADIFFTAKHLAKT